MLFIQLICLPSCLSLSLSPSSLPLFYIPGTPSGITVPTLKEVPQTWCWQDSPQRYLVMHVPMHQPMANQPSKVFSCSKLLQLPQHLHPRGAPTSWSFPGVQHIKPLTSPAASVTLRSLSLQTTIIGQVVQHVPWSDLILHPPWSFPKVPLKFTEPHQQSPGVASASCLTIPFPFLL